MVRDMKKYRRIPSSLDVQQGEPLFKLLVEHAELSSPPCMGNRVWCGAALVCLPWAPPQAVPVRRGVDRSFSFREGHPGAMHWMVQLHFFAPLMNVVKGS